MSHLRVPGLSVPERWWETVKDACPNPIAVKPASANFVELVLATVPNLEFAEYHHPIRVESRLYKEWFRKVLGESHKERARMGWREPDSGVLRHREIEHKYFYLSHRPIDETSDLNPHHLLFFRRGDECGSIAEEYKTAAYGQGDARA